MIRNHDDVLERIGIAEAYERCMGGKPVKDYPKCGKNQYLVRCPDLNHPPKQGGKRDAHPSCALDAEKNVIKCFACGYKSGILGVVIASGHASNRREAIAWLRSDARSEAPDEALPLSPGKRGSTKPLRAEVEVAHYDYVDDAGELLYRVVRKEGYNHQNVWEKRFLQYRPYHGEIKAYAVDGTAIVRAWIYHLGSTCDPREHAHCVCHDPAKPSARRAAEPVPYNLPGLQRAREQRLVVFFPEGEKCADALESLGLIATTRSGGAQALLNDAWARAFRGIDTVVVLADADIHGRRAARQRVEFLRRYVRHVFYVDLFPERSDGYDVHNWIEEQRNVPTRLIITRLRNLIRAAIAHECEPLTVRP